MEQVSNRPYLSVIIPMFNEEANVRSTIDRVEATLSSLGKPFEILPVNDGSTDSTLKKLDEIARKNPRVRVVSYWKNGGRGKALRYGFKAARGELIASIDADLSYEPEYILKMVQALHEDSDVDIILASAYMPGGATEGVPRDRLLISKVGNRILRLSIAEDIHTVTCIVRCYRRAVIESLDLESDDKEIHLEILSKAIAMGFRIKEIPAVLRARIKGKSKFKFRSTAVTHLVFTAFERPVLLFGIIGILLTLIGLGIGIYILALYLNQTLSPGRPLLMFMAIFILGGMQILSFGFLASQINYLRNDVLRIRRAISPLLEQVETCKETKTIGLDKIKENA
jgi:dolichol-phosphate mannosyltransferase